MSGAEGDITHFMVLLGQDHQPWVTALQRDTKGVDRVCVCVWGGYGVQPTWTELDLIEAFM